NSRHCIRKIGPMARKENPKQLRLRSSRASTRARKGGSALPKDQREVSLTAVFVPTEGGYVGFVEEIPGANTQGDILEETRRNLREAVEMVIAANRELAEESIKGERVIREWLQLAVK